MFTFIWKDCEIQGLSSSDVDGINADGKKNDENLFETGECGDGIAVSNPWSDEL